MTPDEKIELTAYNQIDRETVKMYGRDIVESGITILTFMSLAELEAQLESARYAQRQIEEMIVASRNKAQSEYYKREDNDESGD